MHGHCIKALFAVDKTCNPSLMTILNDTNIDVGGLGGGGGTVGFDWRSIIALAIFLVCVLYSRYKLTPSIRPLTSTGCQLTVRLYVLLPAVSQGLLRFTQPVDSEAVCSLTCSQPGVVKVHSAS